MKLTVLFSLNKYLLCIIIVGNLIMYKLVTVLKHMLGFKLTCDKKMLRKFK